MVMTFKSFIKSVEELCPGNSGRSNTSTSTSDSATKKAEREERVKNRAAPYETVESLTEKMMKWCTRKGRNDGENKFVITSSHNKFSFKCLVCCEEKIEISGFCLSNCHRHLNLNCWMNPEAMEKKRKKGKLRHSTSESPASALASAKLMSSFLTKATEQSSASPSSPSLNTEVAFKVLPVLLSETQGENADSEVDAKDSKN